MARARKKVFCVGLTGGLASGKSLVAKMFAQHGAEVIDADAIARELTMPGEAAVFAVRRALGSWSATAQGEMLRDEIRRRVFADEKLKLKLEKVLHPRIRREMVRRIRACRKVYALAVVPLLFETGMMTGEIERAAVVDCPRKLRESRARKRGWSRAQIAAVMAAQMPRKDRLARADDIIKNGAEGKPPAARVLALHQTYTQMAKQ